MQVFLGWVMSTYCSLWYECSFILLYIQCIFLFWLCITVWYVYTDMFLLQTLHLAICLLASLDTSIVEKLVFCRCLLETFPCLHKLPIYSYICMHVSSRCFLSYIMNHSEATNKLLVMQWCYHHECIAKEQSRPPSKFILRMQEVLTCWCHTCIVEQTISWRQVVLYPDNLKKQTD